MATSTDPLGEASVYSTSGTESWERILDLRVRKEGVGGGSMLVRFGLCLCVRRVVSWVTEVVVGVKKRGSKKAEWFR